MPRCRTLAKLKRILIIHMLIRIIRSPRSEPIYVPIVFETISPLWIHDPLPRHTMTAPLSPDVAMGIGTPSTSMSTSASTSSPKPDQLKRVLSSGSNGSGAIATPKNGHAPLSPSSGGVRTPKAAHSAILPEPPGVDGKKDGERLATDLNQLKVQSPVIGQDQLPSISQSIDIPASDVGRGHIPAHRQESDNSSSTDSSSNHPYYSSSLGTSYGPEGFPRTTTPGEDMPDVDPYTSVQAMAAVAAADEAIKQINGTSSVRSAPNMMMAMGMGGGDSTNPFQLPRGYANFVHPEYRDKPQSPPDYSVSRQSSTSSSTTTEASTSSEESDLCVPSIEWVNTKPNHLVPPANSTMSPYQYTPYMPNAVPQVRPRSPVPPPRPAHPLSNAVKAASSPRLSSGGGQGNGHSNGANGAADVKPSLPLGATAHTPSGVASSALPSGMAIDEPAEDDDDEQTVGQNKSRSRSASSESNLDLLSNVVLADHNPQASSSTLPVDGKGKRKAGSRSVAQWRESGIPSGVDNKKTLAGRRVSAAGSKPASAAQSTSTPPRKRRRSEVSDTNIDPALRAEGPAAIDRSESAMEVEDDIPSDASSGDEEELNSGDSEYGATASRTRPKATRPKGGRKVGGSGAAKGRHSVGGSKAAPKKTKRMSGSPADSSRRASTGGATPAGGVQCEYVNPLPVSLPPIQCQVEPVLVLTFFPALQPLYRYLYTEIRLAPSHGKTRTKGR